MMWNRRLPIVDCRLNQKTNHERQISNQQSSRDRRIRRAVEVLESRILFATYNIADLGILSDPTGLTVNGNGQVSLTTDFASDGSRDAARFNAGTLDNIGTFGGPESLAGGVNASGNVAGSASDPSGNFIAFLWNGSTKQNLGTLGGPFSNAFAVNDNGAVVGGSQLSG